MNVLNIGLSVFLIGLGIGAIILLTCLAKILRDEYKMTVGMDNTKDTQTKIKDLQESVDYLYDCYQDIGKSFFNLSEKVDAVKEYIEEQNIADKELGTADANMMIEERLHILKMLE